MSSTDIDSDWREAFDYARAGKGGAGALLFTLADIARIERRIAGEYDGADWLAFGELRDGRWFVLRAGCDYTGWDCQAWGEVEIAGTREEIVTYRMSSEERARLLDHPLALEGFWPDFEPDGAR